MVSLPFPEAKLLVQPKPISSMEAPSGSAPTLSSGPAPWPFPKVCPPATRATVSSSFMAILPKVSRISLPLATGSGLPSGPWGFTYIKPIWTAPSGLAKSLSPLYLSLVSHSVSAPQFISSSGAQISGLPPPKPKVLPPIDSIATFPAKINRSAQLIFFPYFCLIGHRSLLALSKFPLSGQLFKGANRWAPVPPPPRPSPIL